ncbi:hypothetical protein [Luteolibacter luteus]|uniref:Uncharacterized protein n=1 Tax=Luteolibacter luteus TaxID=2728835 RepID=A0A858RLQ1_9BACT|nr:hypothetical protein [Luteolibacter luteus]QJE97655.1 hypothetical protein HHL09_18345 [Luteolibacter luteus]
MNASSIIFGLSLAVLSTAGAQSTSANYTNFIRQKQLPTNVKWDMPVNASGQDQSHLAINPGGAQFELWTVNNVTAQDYKLDSRYVGAYVPVGNVKITSEDPYDVIPRTRADRPFTVEVLVDGLTIGNPEAPEAATKVKFLRHVQSYGTGGTGVGINRTQATLESQSYMEQNATSTISYAITSIPGGNRAKVRGEERFSVFSLEDYQAPASQLGSQFIQIWPLADAAIQGVSNNELIRFKLPEINLTLNDLYPDSHTYAQVYKGLPVLGKTGAIVPGSSLVVNDTVPQSRVLHLTDYDEVFDADGRWTMEIVTKTPFGLDRLAYVSFMLDRTIEFNGSITSQE